MPLFDIPCDAQIESGGGRILKSKAIFIVFTFFKYKIIFKVLLIKHLYCSPGRSSE